MNEDYERLAEYYELIWPRTDDLDFFRELATAHGGPILELACGTGRVTYALSERCSRVVGLDRSPSMLRRAEERRLQMAGGSHVEFRLADMTNFDFDERYALIIAAFSCVFEMSSQDERLALYRRCREHLKPDGVLVIDANFHPRSRKPEWGAVQPSGNVVYKGTFSHPNARRVQYFVSDLMNENLRLTKAIFLDHLSDDDLVTRVHFDITLHYVPPEQTATDLANAGFGSVRTYGGYHGEELFAESLSGRGRQMFIASR